LPAARVRLSVASVLPEGVPADSVAPRAAAPWVRRDEASGWPFLVLLGPLLLAIVVAAWWWRRRGRPPVLPATRPADPMPSRERIKAWTAAGETSLALDHLLHAIPDDDVSRPWRSAVDRVRFDPAARAEAERLVDEGLALLEPAPRSP
jgi:hypothetical protein